MSIWGDIENEFVTRLEALTHEASPALATVRGYMIARDEHFPQPILRERTPAGYVTVRSVFYDPEYFELVRYISVYLAVKNLRSQDDARHGFDNAPGLFTLMQSANAALDGASMPGSHWAFLSGASTVAADPNTLVVRLTYVLYPSSYGTVLLDGDPLPDEDTPAQIVPGSPANRTADFVFPGSNGVLRQVLGPAPRPVDVRGILRAGDEQTLCSKEADLEALAHDSQTHTISDAGGRVLNDCVGKSYERQGTPTPRWGNLPLHQRFVLRFEQLTY